MAIQAYHLRIPGLASASPLSVSTVLIKEQIGKPYEAELTVTTSGALDLLAALDQTAIFAVTPVPENGLSALRSAPSTIAQPVRQWAGVVRNIKRLGSSRDEFSYQIRIAPRVARLQQCVDTRLYQNLDIPGVIEAVLRNDLGFKGDDFVIKTTRPYPVLEHITRWQEDGLRFISRLCESCGLSFYFQQTPDKEVIVFIDDQSNYLQPLGVQLYRPEAGLESGWNEAVLELSVSATPIIGQHQLHDYNYRNSTGADLLGSKSSASQVGQIGHAYRYGAAHHKDAAQGKAAAQLDYEIALAGQIIAEGVSTVLAFAPAQIFRTDQPDPQAEWGWVITAVTHQASRNAAWSNRFNAIPAERIIRLPRDTAKPTISGTIPARIASPSKYSNAYLSEDGLYRVAYLFDADYRNGHWPPAGSSRLMRLARPYAGDTYGFHMPLIDGTEVQVAFQNGDIDRPYIAYAMHDQSKPDHVTQRNHTRNVIRTPSNNKIRLEDKDAAQHIKIASEYGKSQLNLGHLVDAQREQRGDGFELRSDGWGALRAGKGVLVSAYAQGRAKGKQLEMDAVVSELQQALQLAEALRDAASTATADAAETETQRQLLHESLKGLQQPGVLIGAPAGVAIATPQSVQLSAGENLMLTAARHADLSVIKKLTVAAGDAISLFAQKSGIKLFASQGKVDIQAQHGAMNLQAQQNLNVISTSGKVVITGKEEILLNAGGAYIRIKDGNIELGGPGDLLIKTFSVNKQGANSMSQSFNSLPLATYDQEIAILNPSGKPVPHQAFELMREDGTRITGVTDALGNTGIQKTDAGVGRYRLNMLDGGQDG